jgi:hypothetical protein
MRLTRKLVLAVVLLAACRGKSNAEAKQREERKAAAAAVQGLDTIPAEAQVVVGINVARLAQSPLVQHKFLDLLARNPDARAMLEGLVSRCGIDPAKDLESVLLALGGKPDGARRDSMMVVRGKLDETKLVDCVKKSVAEKGGTVDTKNQDGMTIYVVNVDPPLSFTFGAPDTLIVAQREALLVEARDPKVPKVKTDATMMGLISGADTRAALWGAGRMSPEIGERLTKVTQDTVKQPADAIFGHVDLTNGMTIEMNLHMASHDDAKALGDFIKQQLKSYTVIAQNYGLGQVLAKTKVDVQNDVFRVSLAMDPADVEKVEGLIDEQIQRHAPKPGDAGPVVTPDGGK